MYDIFNGVWNMGEITLQVNRDEISYLKFILEGYDGLGIVTTKDPIAAKVIVTYPLTRRFLLGQLIHALQKEGIIREGNII